MRVTFVAFLVSASCLFSNASSAHFRNVVGSISTYELSNSDKFIGPNNKDNHHQPISSDRDISMVKLKFSGENIQGDECVLNFVENATGNYDWGFDAMKVESLVAEAAECALISTDNFQLAIDSRPFPESEQNVEVFVDMPSAGNYELEVLELENLPFGYCARIFDPVNSTYVPLELGQVITVHSDTPYTGVRFEIQFAMQVQLTVMNPVCNNEQSGAVYIEADNSWNIQFADAISLMEISGTAAGVFEGLSAGLFVISIQNELNFCPEQNVMISIEEPMPFNMEVLSFTPDKCNNNGNGVIELNVENASQYNYVLTNSQGEELFNEITTEALLLLGELNGDIYSMDVSGECGSQSLLLDLRDPSAVDMEILSGDIYFEFAEGSGQSISVEQNSSNASSLQWMLNNEPAGNDEFFTWNFQQQGNYQLICIAENEICNKADTIMIEADMFTALSEVAMDHPITMIVAGDYLTFSMNVSSSDRTCFGIYDAAGRMVWSMTTSTQKGKTVETTLSPLPVGTYFVRSTCGEKLVLSKKVQKME